MAPLCYYSTMALSVEKIKEIISLRKAGKSKKQIKSITGCAITTIEKHLLQNGFTKEQLSDNWKGETIYRLVEFPGKKSDHKKFFMIQLKALDKLLKSFPNIEFWQKVSFAGGKVKSLNYLLHDPTYQILKDKYHLFNYKIPEKPKIEEGEKVGEDSKVDKPIRTIKDFLNT